MRAASRMKTSITMEGEEGARGIFLKLHKLRRERLKESGYTRPPDKDCEWKKGRGKDSRRFAGKEITR